MATNPTGGTRVPLVERVKNILTTPKTEWPVIDAEPSTIADIYRNYVVILAAIGPICMLIGFMLFLPIFPIGYLVAQAVITYILTLVGVYVTAMIIEALAPTFGGTKDRLKAFKVAAYASTAGWVAGIFLLLPYLAILALIAALYGLYLLYLGLPVLMRVSADKAVGYTVAVIVAAIVIYFLVGMVTTALLGAMMPGPTIGSPLAIPS